LWVGVSAADCGIQRGMMLLQSRMAVRMVVILALLSAFAYGFANLWNAMAALAIGPLRVSNRLIAPTRRAAS
jgi:hypothetical protein